MQLGCSITGHTCNRLVAADHFSTGIQKKDCLVSDCVDQCLRGKTEWMAGLACHENFLYRRCVLSREELIAMDGIVEEVLPDSKFRVTLDNGHALTAYSSGKMRKNH